MLRWLLRFLWQKVVAVEPKVVKAKPVVKVAAKVPVAKVVAVEPKVVKAKPVVKVAAKVPVAKVVAVEPKVVKTIKKKSLNTSLTSSEDTKKKIKDTKEAK